MGLIILGLLLGIIGNVVYAVLTISRNDSYAVRNNSESKHKIKPGIVAAILLAPIILFTLLASTVSVGTGEIAVMTRYGRVTGTELSEGLHIKAPIDKANIYDVKVQKDEAVATAASKDLQDVNARVVVNYAIDAGKVSNLHKTVGVLYKEKLVDNAIQEVTKGAVAKYDATQLITERPAVKAQAYTALKNRLEPYGISIRDLSITNFTFSAEFTKAIESKQVAQQDAEKAVFLTQKAQQEANATIEQARGQAESQRLLTETASTESIELKKLEVQQSAINKWNGVLPTTQAGDGNSLLIQPATKQ